MGLIKLLYCLTVLVLIVHINNVITHQGTECETDADCANPKQLCSLGDCRCKEGLVQYEGSCYNVSYYGEACMDDAQCQGLLCYPMKIGGKSRCQCGRFSVFNRTTARCDLKYNNSQMMEMLPMQRDDKALIEKEADYIFRHAVIAGCLAMTLMATVGLCAILYCIHMERMDNKLKSWIKKAEAERPQTAAAAGNTNPDVKNDAMHHEMDVDPGDVGMDMDFDM